MDEYIVFKNKDSYGGDINKYNGQNSIENLKKNCDFILDCVGFNTYGYMKKYVHDIDSLIDAEGCDLYIRKDRIQNTVEFKKKFLTASLDITFIVTTCKRLKHFCETMDKLIYYCQDFHLVKKWICIDDGSSEKDRKEMRKKYPFFHFVMKTEEQKGHSKSLNMAFELVKTKYVFFFEDDWRCNIPFYIAPYIDFLEKFGKDQIIFHGRPESHGYPKLACINDKNIYSYCYNPNHPDKDLTSLKSYYEKFEKKFNIKSDGIGFFYPGFSLNPSIFSIEKIKANKLCFSESQEYHDCFELYFAFECLKAGFQTSFTNIIICHIGTDTSAYVLNGTPRCFD